MYTTWHLWKERKEDFLGHCSITCEVFHLLKDEFRLRRDACGGGVLQLV
jgi:hypothetical protein